MTHDEVTAAMKAEDAWVEKGARAMWNAQTRQPWQQVDDGDEWPSWVDLATRDRLREKFRHALAAVLPEIQAQALRDAADEMEAEYEERTTNSGAYGQTKIRAALLMGAGMVRDRADRLTATAEGPTK